MICAYMPDGSTFAGTQNVLSERQLAEFQIGGIEIVTETTMNGPERFSEDDERLLIELSVRSGRAVNFNELSHSWVRPNAWKYQIAYMERAAREGAQVFKAVGVFG